MSGIYIHIPFCIKKCLYCDFVSKCCDNNTVLKYFEKLNQEIIQKSLEYNDNIETIYFGGGTPTSVDSSFITQTLKNILDNYNVNRNAEITIEMNPGTVNEKKLKEYKLAGFNRLSIGLQSANDNELRNLGRIHTVKEFEDNYYLARSIGFENINIDLMSAIPGQTISSYKKNLEYVIKLNPEHISSYSLIIEEGTPFYNMYYGKEIISEDDERRMYSLTKDILKEHGYNRYEISNYCKQGFESRHNSSYWTRKDYLGFGVAAASLEQNERRTNTNDINEYIGAAKLPLQEQIILTKQEQMEEFVFLGLRMMKGINLDKFYEIFDVKFEELYHETLKKMIDLGLLFREDNTVRLTEKGIDVSNLVMSEFLL